MAKIKTRSHIQGLIFFTSLLSIFLILPLVSGLYCPYVERSNGEYVEYKEFMNSSGDGAVVFDRDGDNIVDAEDLFGGRNLTGRDVDNAFEDLALLDDNGDGIYNGSDPNFTQLKIWRANETGSALELVPLNSTINLTRINLAYRNRQSYEPAIWAVAGTYNSSNYGVHPIAIGANFTNINGYFTEGDFLVLDFDNANNITIANTTQCSTPITINLQSPANGSTQSSDSTPGFTFNITDNSATVNCTLWINSSSGIVSAYGNNVSVVNATPTTMSANSSLSNGNYYWWISCTDDSGAPVEAYNSSKRFLTMSITESSSDSSSSSSSGGGTASESFWTNTFADDNAEFSEKETISRNLSIKQRIRTKINGEQHHIGIINITNTSATINISSTPQQAVLNVGESKKFDVDADKYYDILVNLISIENSKAELKLNYLHEAIPETEGGLGKETTESENESGLTDNIEKTSKGKNYFLIIITILIIIGIIFYLYNRKNYFLENN